MKAVDRKKRKQMNKKTKTLQILGDYFVKKGKVLSIDEYKKQDDAPMRFIIAKRPFGSWARMISMLEYNFPKVWEDIHKPKPKPAPKKVAKKKEEK